MEEKFTEALREALEMESVDGDISMEDEFRNYENWDSLARLSLIAVLDEEFEVEIEDEEFEQLTTVGDLFEAVKSKTSD